MIKMNRRTNTGVSQRWALLIVAALLMVCTSLTASAREHKYTGVGENKYYSNMTMTTRVMIGDDVLLDCEVAAFVGDECRSSWLSHPEQDGLVFQLIPGEKTGQILTFRVVYTDDNGQEQDVLADQTFVYKNDTTVGDAAKPYIIELPGKPKVQARYADGTEKGFWLSDATDDKLDSVAMAANIYIKGIWTADDYASLRDALTTSQKLNPCQLRYLPADTELPTGWTNTISGTKALTDITLADGTQQAPASLFIADDIDLNGHTATYTRNFALANGKGGWNTVIMPFAFEVYADDEKVNLYTEMEAEDTKGYWALRLDYGDDDGLVFEKMTGKGKKKIAAYTPYLIAFPGNNFNVNSRNISLAGKTITLRSTSQTLAATPDYLSNLTVEEDETQYALMGTFTAIRKQPMYLLRPGVNSDGSDAFCYYAEGNLMPFRAYLTDLTGTNAARMFGLNIDFDDKGTTGIVSMENGQWTMDNAQRSTFNVYDLQGRRLNSVPRKQLLIINGKKVLVK